jgi:hypothetical protein
MITGQLDSTVCCIQKPLNGHVSLELSHMEIIFDYLFILNYN